MDARQAAYNLEVIRTLMERTCQYQLLTARAGLAAGSPGRPGEGQVYLRRPSGDVPLRLGHVRPLRPQSPAG
jgi:hypothetical protein